MSPKILTTITNRAGLEIWSKFLKDPTAPEILEASSFSGAVRRYQSMAVTSSKDPAILLRQKRRQEWLRSAVPALSGSLSSEEVCRAWSQAADQLLQDAFQECFKGEVALFALGKLGSHELNLSSDVDLLLVARKEDPETTQALRRFQKILSEPTADGFVFRVDFDLRPGGKQGPLVPTVDQLMDYYGNYGETWERMAFVRLRPITGDPEVIKEVMDFSVRFSFRKHLDFNLLEELKSLRKKIHAEHWKRSSNGRIDLKLGIGGIRDVELFFHALQVIHGGKDPSLRVRETSKAGEVLKKNRLLSEAEANFLVEHYWALRSLENFVQAQEDRQTHILELPAEPPSFIQKLCADLPQKMERASSIVSALLGHPPSVTSEAEVRAEANSEELLRSLDEILEIPLLSRNRERDENTRRSFLKKFFEVLEDQGADRVMAVDQLKDFLRATRAKASFFTLLLREESLLRELAWLFGHSRYLGGILCFRPELLDSYIYRSQDLDLKDFEKLLGDLAEKRLLSELIEGSRFLRDQNLPRTTAALTATADEIVGVLATAVREQCPSDVRLLALGKWGGRETGFRSDLDLIFVHPKNVEEKDLRFARRMISRLTDSHKGGRIYPVDLRLRPSGKAGPLVISLAQLQNYLQNEAQPWERQAYLKARWLDSEENTFGKDITQKPLSSEDLFELNRIRGELLPKDERLDLKYSEGGLLDIELSVQALLLQKQQASHALNTLKILEDLAQKELHQIYCRLRQFEQLLQLLSTQSISRVDQNHESLQVLAALLKIPSMADLQSEVRALLQASTTCLAHLDPRRAAR